MGAQRGRGPVGGLAIVLVGDVNTHHGDGRVAVCCKASPSNQGTLIAADPEQFYRPAYLARYGWVSLQLDLPTVD